MTIRIFEHNAYQQSCEAVIEAIDDDGAIILDQTIFYPEGGGQPGDSGQITTEDGIVVAIADTQKAPDGQLVRHLPFENVPSGDAPFENASGLAVGQTVKLAIDWQRRLCHMRMHTALHLLCALLPHSVTGCQIGAAKSRMDFDPEGNQFSKEKLQQDLQALITANHSVNVEWISDSELAAQPELVRTMSVKPPSGQGRVRLLRIGDAIDLQPCGGTHLRTTGEIGAMKIAKIENKGRANRRVSIVFAD